MDKKLSALGEARAPGWGSGGQHADGMEQESSAVNTLTKWWSLKP